MEQQVKCLVSKTEMWPGPVPENAYQMNKQISKLVDETQHSLVYFPSHRKESIFKQTFRRHK